VSQGFAGGVDAVRLADQRAELPAQGVQRALGFYSVLAQPSGERVKDGLAPVILPIDPFGRARFDHERAAPLSMKRINGYASRLESMSQRLLAQSAGSGGCGPGSAVAGSGFER
jgi:hypothetical protein